MINMIVAFIILGIFIFSEVTILNIIDKKKTRTVNCSPPEGSRSPEPKNQYGVGENDLPTTKSPGVPGFSKISYKNVDFNELGIPMLKYGTIPKLEVKPVKQKSLEEYTLAEIYEGSNELKRLIIKALKESITNENVHEIDSER